MSGATTSPSSSSSVMATTSSWGLGTRKVSTDIPSPTPVSSQPTDLSVRTKNYSMGAASTAAATSSESDRDDGKRGPVNRSKRKDVFSSAMGIRAPQGTSLPSRVQATDANRALEISGCMRDHTRALPPPIEFPQDPMPCMVGQFRFNESTGVHRCVGKWAMAKKDLEHYQTIKSLSASFELKISAGGPDSFPINGNYTSHFYLRRSSKDMEKVSEKHLYMHFEKNLGGTWNVHGYGVNIYGSFTVTGRLDTNHILEVYRAYTKTPLRRYRRCSVCVPVAVTASADDASSLPPAPTRRIKDIGKCYDTHLSKGLRRCVRLLGSLMNVSEKSIWFNEPVDHVGLQLHDYLTIIKRPMDLGTVRHKLERGEYQNTAEFAADVRLVFSNAMLYNSDPNSLVHKAAQALFKLFQSKFTALGSNLDEPSIKRETSKSESGGGSSGDSTSNSAAACADDAEHSSTKANRGKRKGSRGGNKLGKRVSKKARAEAAVPLTISEKKALTDAINTLDNENDIIPVIEMILTRMPLRGSEEEIEVYIESIDTQTLRDLQSYIRELSERGV